MKWSIRLFRVKGIDVKVHLTFILILIWAAYRWGSNTGAGLEGALFGVVATLLLFAAVTLHELAHSWQARKFGVRVRDITLLPMGGLAQMEEIPANPRQELRIALAGPLTNLAIAAALIGLGTVLSIPAVMSVPELFQSVGEVSWAGMLAYLTMANLALGLFNLIPAFPMDGGRVLRALLALRMDHAKATSVAARVGQGLAFLLGLWGMATGSYSLLLIAIFVWLAAGQEGKESKIKNTLGTMTVRQAMTSLPQALTPDDSLSTAVHLTLSTAQSHFPVVSGAGATLVGLLTESDLLAGLSAYGMAATVGQAMRHDFPAIRPDAPLFEAQQKMSAGRLGAAPVVSTDGRLIGLLTAADINEAYRLSSVNAVPVTSEA